MNRIEFMAELESLLSNIPAEERDEAMQYYRDYFEDAGVENEMQIIAELGSPQKVAQTIKEGLQGKSEESSEYRETGYTDTRFEEKETPANTGEYSYTQSEYGDLQPKEKTNNLVKILLIIAIIIVGAPVIFPVAMAIVGTIFAIAFSGFAILGSFVIAAVCVAIAGIAMVVGGLIKIFSFPAVGLVVCGGGMLLFVLGLAASVLLVKLCIVSFPVIFRWVVNIFRWVINMFRRLFSRKGTA